MRLFGKIKKARQHIIALIKAIPDFISVGFFLLFFFFTYAVFGLYLFSDSSYYRCRETEFPVNATYWPKNPENIWCDPLDLDYCPNG